MWRQTHQAPATAELLGDLRPLIEQLGAPGALSAKVSPHALNSRPITTADELRTTLQNYLSTVLQPLELPAIQRAFHHATRNELRELIAFDNQLAGEATLKNFSAASRAVGQNQLARLRPLRDQRMVQRYLAAIEKGEANGWHTLIYGLTLAVYSLPLRQGLYGYALLTTHGFIQSAARSLLLSEADCKQLLADLSENFPAAVEPLLVPTTVG